MRDNEIRMEATVQGLRSIVVLGTNNEDDRYVSNSVVRMVLPTRYKNIDFKHIKRAFSETIGVEF